MVPSLSITDHRYLKWSTCLISSPFSVIGNGFSIEEPLPAEFTIEAASTQRALQNVKCRKATGLDNIPPWMVNNYAHLLAAPVTAIFNSSLREGKIPDLWKTATIVPFPKKHPPGSLENDIRPISHPNIGESI